MNAIAYQNPVMKKDLGIALVLNLLWPGVGYFYYGKLNAGLACFIFVPLFSFVTIGAAWPIYLMVMCWHLVKLHNKGKRKLIALTVKTCPACAEQVKVEAQVCRFCSHKF